jgi:hypothetical protein
MLGLSSRVETGEVRLSSSQISPLPPFFLSTSAPDASLPNHVWISRRHPCCGGPPQVWADEGICRNFHRRRPKLQAGKPLPGVQSRLSLPALVADHQQAPAAAQPPADSSFLATLVLLHPASKSCLLCAKINLKFVLCCG